MRKLTQKQFIEKARTKHGEKFDYVLVEYKGNRTPIKIRCPTHGVFEQAPQKHIDGKHGCPKCALIARGHKHRLAKLSWVDRANDVHQSKYDYSRVDYKTGRDKVEIICRDHGHFFQRAENHILLTHGCPQMRWSGHRYRRLY